MQTIEGMLNRRLNILLWILVVVPSITVVITELNKRVLIWHIRIVDFVDLVFIAPFYLFILLSIHAVIFSNQPGRWMQWLSFSCIGVYLYGHAMHLTGNAINTYSTEIRNYKDMLPTDTYELIYFFDEKLGHWLMFGAFFLLLGIWTIASNITGKSWGAVGSGAVFGLTYAVFIIEGSQPWLGFVVSLCLVGCNFWKKHKSKDSWRHYYFTHPIAAFGMTSAILLVLGEIIYALIFGGFIQPSSIGS